MNQTQSSLLIEYILEFGSACPAKLTGTEYKGGFFGSEISRRARDLRKAGRLTSVSEGKFERFFLVEQDEVLPAREAFDEMFKEPLDTLSKLRIKPASIPIPEVNLKMNL